MVYDSDMDNPERKVIPGFNHLDKKQILIENRLGEGPWECR